MDTQTKPTILFLDDEDLNLFLFKTAHEEKYDIITTSTPNEALETLRHNHSIKLVISDYRMAEMNGVDFVKLAKTNHPEKAYFLLTAFGDTDEIADAIDSKFLDGYFEKPMNREEIRKSLDRALTELK